MYDYLIVGSGLFGAVFAHEMQKAGKTCMVIERRNHIGGNCYTEEQDGIQVHKYGAHIFRTSNKEIWDYIKGFAEFNHFVNTPIANFHGEIYNMPFNMNTFSKMWGISTPAEAKRIIEEQRKEITGTPRNLEEQAISLVGRDVYEKLIKGYTEKQWGRPCNELPASIIRRLPIRLTYNNNYYVDPYQGIPVGGFTSIMEKMFQGCRVVLEEDYNANPEKYRAMAKRVLYTGPIDEYFGFCYGELQYRSLRFEHIHLDMDNYQGVAVVNYTDRETPYTRIIEHKHFEFGQQPTTIISKEYPFEWKRGIEPYYPINDAANQALYEKYRALGDMDDAMIFGGRLGTYQYTDMQDTIIAALKLAASEKCR
ncbi:MAG: UDP-galactopyranose mutase [Clostridia bacterium]|nr:UDP-galactopyranose mutase [Clostridia bacterium]